MSMWLRFALLGLFAVAPDRVMAQVVAVTMRLDTNTISVGGSTTLRVFAQVTPNLRANAERIFSWYVDVLNTNGFVASANYGSMQKTASDNDLDLSSTGSTDGAHRRGIYDTFLNLTGAGVASPVELMAIPVTGLAAGQTRFQVRAGSGVPQLSSDFLVNPLAGSTPLTGGDYSAANVDLRVGSAPACAINLQLTPLGGNAGLGQRLLLSFVPCPGYDHTVQYRDALDDAAGWRSLSGAPHNSGSLTVTNAASQRFYRVSTSQAGALGELRLNIASLPPAGGSGQRLLISYPTVAGYSYTIQFRSDVSSSTLWQTMAGGPFNSGGVVVTNTGPAKFYRVVASQEQ